MNAARSFRLAAIAQLAGLTLAGWWFRHALNTDAVAYLRIAEYYADGKLLLALSGYWGPLLSWLMVPLLKLGCAPLVAARIVMGFSAIVFFWGCLAWFRAVKLSDRWLKLGAWTAAAVSIPWSVGNITPDLLLAGVMAWAASFLLQAPTGRPFHFGLLAGLGCGVAFLTKAVALPLSVAVGLAWFGWLWRSRHLSRAAALTALAAFLLGMGVLVTQWACLLTSRYGRPTITRSAPIAHAIAGPTDVERYHPPMRAFHRPSPGRITAWEDPSELAYQNWSPLANSKYALHQAKVIAVNLGLSQVMLTTVFLDWPCVLGLVVWLRARKRFVVQALAGSEAPRSIEASSGSVNAGLPSAAAMRFAAIFLGALTLVYLPNYMRFGDQRFFYPALPFLFLAGVWFLERSLTLLSSGQTPSAEGIQARCGRWLTWALAASFVLPAAVLMFIVLPPKRQAGELAQRLAAALAQAKLPPGPLAGSALQPGGRTGLFTAYWLKLPWYGDETRATAESCRRSGARYILVNGDDPLAGELAKSGYFSEVTPASLQPAVIQVFGLRQP